MPADSVSIEAIASPDANKKRRGASLLGLKELALLYLIIMVVMSDVFRDNVLCGFGEKAVRSREPTSWGHALMGMFMVLMYIIVIHISDKGII